MHQWVLPDGPSAPDQERPQGRHARHARDLVPPERFQEVPRQPGAEQVQRRAGPQGGRELAHPSVEVEGERREYPVFLRVLQVRRDDLGPHHHVALARRDALGHPSRPRGVEDGPQVRLGDIPVLLQAFARQGLRYVHVGTGGWSFRLRALVEGGVDRLRLEFLELRGVPEHDPDITVAGEILDLGRFEQGVHVDVDGAYARRCEHRHDGFPRLLQVDAYPVAPPYARLSERGAERTALALQVFVGILCIAVHDRRFLRVVLHGVVKQIMEREFRTLSHAALLSTSLAMASTDPKFSSSNSSSSTTIPKVSSRNTTSSTVCNDVMTPLSMSGSSFGMSRPPVTFSWSHPRMAALASPLLETILPPI